MKIAVVTPVGPDTRLEHLNACRESVSNQLHPCEHIRVADGYYGSGWDDMPITLPHACNDIGSTPRTIGTAYAFGQGFDAVAWLDADNWIEPDHITKLVKLHHDTGKPVLASGRAITDLAGVERAECREQVPLTGFFDTSTMMVTRQAIGIGMMWAMLPKNAHIIGDRIISDAAMQAGIACHYEPTMVYRSSWRFHYVTNGWEQEGLELK